MRAKREERKWRRGPWAGETSFVEEERGLGPAYFAPRINNVTCRRDMITFDALKIARAYSPISLQPRLEFQRQGPRARARSGYEDKDMGRGEAG